MRGECPHRREIPLSRRPANALNVEIGAPAPRCMLKPIPEWEGREPKSGPSLLHRWIGSGGSLLILEVCGAPCPLAQASKE